MKNWIELSKKEYKNVWDKIYNEFNFKPSISQFPSFTIPSSYITYDVSIMPEDLNVIDNLYNELEEKSLIAFQEITQKNEYIYALNWQHACYWINLNLEFPRDEDGEWTIPIFPDGDYHFFIQKDFQWGYLGHPWEKTITVFGDELISAVDKHRPKVFKNVIRKSYI
ncbi:DUF2716 domain-containing protein [Microbacteriaceae bacterium 4G12]